MISSGYSVHLYCSCEACRTGVGNWRKYNGGFAEYAEPTKALTLAAARAHGWRIEFKSGRCWAPGHVKRASDTAEL